MWVVYSNYKVCQESNETDLIKNFIVNLFTCCSALLQSNFLQKQNTIGDAVWSIARSVCEHVQLRYHSLVDVFSGLKMMSFQAVFDPEAQKKTTFNVLPEALVPLPYVSPGPPDATGGLVHVPRQRCFVLHHLNSGEYVKASPDVLWRINATHDKALTARSVSSGTARSL